MNAWARGLTCLAFWCVMSSAWPLAAQTPVFINEIHYDNTGTDAGEAIEIAGPAGTDLTGWSLVLYNGSTGLQYDSDPLSGPIPDLGGGFGVVVLNYAVNGIQNGAPDGIALVNASSTVVQFLTYEGSFTALDGPAAGMTSVDIGVLETGSEPLGQSLRLSGTGTQYEDFTWNSPATATFGAFNTGQSFGGVDQPPSVLSTAPADGAAGIAVNSDITINFSEAVNVTGSWFSINGSSSGSHTATASAGPLSFILNPGADFVANETITVTIFAANVTDQDVSDPPDNMLADYTFSFTTIAVASSVVINELDSDTPGTDALEFVELYDGGTGNTSLDGLVVVFYNGSNDLSYAAFDLDGFSTDANGYFLMGNSGVTPAPSLTFAGNFLQNGADAIALYLGNASNFPNGSAVTTANLFDAVVYDTDDADAPGLLVLLNAGQPQVNENGGGDGPNHSSQRIPNGSGGARNTVSYAQFPPTPGTENIGPPPPVMAEIYEIQGAGLLSPFANQTVITENNVVTAVAANGFAMQTPEARADADIETSNGIFVFTGSAPAVAVGDFVNVTGQVLEFFNFTEFSNSPAVTVVSSGNPVPAPIVLDAFTPSPNQPQPANELERYEGMLIQINGGSVTGPNQFFGTDPIAEVFITAAPNRTFREPGIVFPGLPLLPVWDGNPEVFELDPDRLGLPNQVIPAGSSFDALGVLGFEFNDYEFWPTQFSFAPATLPRAVRSRNSDEATVGTLNLFRLFDNLNDPGSQDDGDVVSASEYARRLAKFSLYIRNVLGAPDILAVEEAEKLEVLEALANKIAADDPSVVYTPYLIEGNDVGGIDTGFLVRSTAQVDAVTQLGATETLSVDGSLLHDRPPLLLEGSFVLGSASSPIAVMAVHNRSLNGIEDPVNGPRIRQKRLEQAQSIAQKVQDLQTANPNVRLVVTGDFNAYQFTDGYVDAVGQIAGDFNPGENLLSGPDLVNPDLTKQVLSLPAEEQYSFIFDGSAQVLDHVLTSQALKPAGLQYGRGNSDAAENLINDDSTPLRSSDHDGLVLYLDVVPPAITITGSPAELWSPNHHYETYTIADFVTSVTDGSTPGLSLADVFIVSATSDEPENAPGDDDGNTSDDIVIVDCQTIQLRSERQDYGNGRVYTVVVAAEDASGNVGTASFQVQVPADQSGAVAIDDGAAYEVLSGCSAPAVAVMPGAAMLAKQNEGREGVEMLPADFGLQQNYPNPFNPETEIRFQLPAAAHVEIRIYNALGREIVTLADGQFEAGYHRVRWQGRDRFGKALASGIYFYQLRAGSFSQVRRMNLLR